MKLDVLAVAAHPDDAEITCGGVLIKMADAGHATGVLDLTRGEMATLGTPEARQVDAEKAAAIMRLAVRRNLGLPDSALEHSHENIKKIAAVIRELKPDTIILPLAAGQRHPDHRIASQLGYDACFLAGLKKADLEGEAHRPRKIIYASSYIETRHSFFVDISDQFDRKKQAVLAFASQFDGSEQSKQIFKPGNDIVELMEVYHRKYGIEVGCRYAEAFVVAEPMLVENPADMPVRSI